MICTLASLIAIAYLAITLSDPVMIGCFGVSVLIAVPCILLLITVITPAITWQAIQRTEQKVFPRAFELIFKDYLFYIFVLVIVSFTLYSFTLVFINKEMVLALPALLSWLFFFGVSFDLMVLFVRRLLRYCHHQFLLDRVDKQVVKLVRDGNDKESFHWLETAIEVAARAICKKSMHVARDSLASVQTMCEHFTRAASRVEAMRPFGQTGPTLLDEVNYLTTYVCRRLDWLSSLAMENHFDPINEDIVNTLGKMSLFFARYSPDVAKFPLLFAQRIACSALDQNRDELAIQCCLILSEVTKGLIHISKEKRETRKDVIIAALQHLETVATAIYQKNRETNIALLMQPFAEVAQLLGNEQFTDLLDREEIITELKRILQSFGALDMVMMRIQPAQ